MTLDELAQEIHETAASHGFWPEDREDALKALDALAEAADAEDDYSEEWTIVRNYIMAQEARNMGEMLMLAVSELAEGLEEHRDGNPVHYYKLKMSPALSHTMEDVERWHQMDAEELAKWGITKKPEGLAVELADCIIRCLDTMHSLDVNIDEIVREKMAYNAGREHKHGRAY